MNMRELQQRCREDRDALAALSEQQVRELEKYFYETAVALVVPVDHARAITYQCLTESHAARGDVIRTMQATSLTRAIALIDYIIEENRVERYLRST